MPTQGGSFSASPGTPQPSSVPGFTPNIAVFLPTRYRDCTGQNYTGTPDELLIVFRDEPNQAIGTRCELEDGSLGCLSHERIDVLIRPKANHGIRFDCSTTERHMTKHHDCDAAN